MENGSEAPQVNVMPEHNSVEEGGPSVLPSNTQTPIHRGLKKHLPLGMETDRQPALPLRSSVLVPVRQRAAEL